MIHRRSAMAHPLEEMTYPLNGMTHPLKSGSIEVAGLLSDAVRWLIRLNG
jgi:hypothetical protein